MKKSLWVLMLLLLAPLAFSQDIYNSKNLIVDLSINSELELTPTSGEYQVDYLKADLFLYPKDDINQDVISLKTSPTPDDMGEAINFRWDNPEAGKLGFSVNSEIMTNDRRIKVKEKVSFPIRDVPSSVLIYTRPSETIDSDNPEIIKLASELASGEDDLYVVVHKAGVWVKKNVQYDLSTLTQGVSQKASWVLKERYGVCDEMTNLFIGLLRSLGIPARFISGVSYTELIEGNWGAHGWAEIYFPGYGWIPFDVTYGEYGYLDSTHITLHKSADANDPSTKYLWYGRSAELNTGSLKIEAEVKQMIGKPDQDIRVNTFPVKDEIGFGSYNLIGALVENLGDSYYATELHLSKPKEVQLRCCDTKSILLKPNEKRRVYWTVSIDENLKETSIYTFPIVVWSTRNITTDTSFRAAVLNKVYSKEEIENLLQQKETEEEKTYSKNIDIICNITKPEFYFNDKATVSCSIKNTGNVLLQGLELCGADECGTIDLGITQTAKREFDIYPKSAGAFEFIFSAQNQDVSKAEYVRYTVLDRPAVSIKKLTYPESVPYGQDFSIEFAVNKESISTPKKVSIQLYQGNLAKSWQMEELHSENIFKINTNSMDLGLNENRFRVQVEFEDELGNEYTETKEFTITLTDVPGYKWLPVAMKSMMMGLGFINLKRLVYMLGIVAIVFIVVISIVTKKGSNNFIKGKPIQKQIKQKRGEYGKY